MGVLFLSHFYLRLSSGELEINTAKCICSWGPTLNSSGSKNFSLIKMYELLSEVVAAEFINGNKLFSGSNHLTEDGRNS